MKRIVMAGVLALASWSVVADPVQLASLANVDGKIMVNKGRGFVSAKPGMTLNEGDRIIALDGSRAAVVYPDGCVTQIKENSLLALEKGAGCNKEPVRTGGTREPLRYAQAIGQSSDAAPGAPLPAGGGSGAPIVVPSAGAGGLGFGGVGVGGLLFGGLVLGGIAIDNRHNQPISPH
jgi:hypothetical protein